MAAQPCVAMRIIDAHLPRRGPSTWTGRTLTDEHHHHQSAGYASCHRHLIHMSAKILLEKMGWDKTSALSKVLKFQLQHQKSIGFCCLPSWLVVATCCLQ